MTRIRAGRGEIGWLTGTAGSKTFAAIGGGTVMSAGCSSSATWSMNRAARTFATCEARSGSLSVTVAVIRTVSGSVEALTRSASSAPSCSARGPAPPRPRSCRW